MTGHQVDLPHHGHLPIMPLPHKSTDPEIQNTDDKEVMAYTIVKGLTCFLMIAE